MKCAYGCILSRNLELLLKPGETLETGSGRKIVLGSQLVDLTPEVIGGSIRRRGWILHVDPSARLAWPVYPYNPYRNAPEKSLQHAAGALSVPLRLKSVAGHYVRPHEQQIDFALEAN